MAVIIKISKDLYVNDIHLKDPNLNFDDEDQRVLGFDLQRDRAKMFRNLAYAEFVQDRVGGIIINCPET